MSSPEPMRPMRWEPVLEPATLTAWAVPDLRLVGDPEPEEAAASAEAPAPAGPDLEEMAYARGHADGERAAHEAQARRSGAALEALAGAARALEAVRASFASEMEESLYALAVAVAQQVIQREIAADPTIVRDLVRRAIDVLPIDGTLEVRLHPADLAALNGDLELFAQGGRTLDLQWVADASIERGGYLLETGQRIADGQLEPALRALYERLRHG